MLKPLKKVFLPSGLIASLYNVYGGSGKEGESLTTHDIHLLCSYLEFYFNYTNIESKKYVYSFYTIPQFYSARQNDELDKQALRANASLQGKYITKVSDEVNSPFGELYRAMQSLKDEKSVMLKKVIQALPSEVDSLLNNDETIDYDNLAKNPFVYGSSLEAHNFRTKELYDRVRTSKTNPSERFPMFVQEPFRDASSFYLLNPAKSKKNMTRQEFVCVDSEIKRHVADFFESDSYKVFAENKREKFAPDVLTFIDCFKKAVSAYNKMDFAGLNRRFSGAVNRARDNMIDLELIGE